MMVWLFLSSSPILEILAQVLRNRGTFCARRKTVYLPKNSHFATSSQLTDASVGRTRRRATAFKKFPRVKFHAPPPPPLSTGSALTHSLTDDVVFGGRTLGDLSEGGPHNLVHNF